ncbi:erythromycin esterase family protein [Laceyella putida]|uniref:Erythromycin esterase family protein n=1 Tax=Laceyella putida TaxID=110101 RepID=A0ABW2RFJ7_9BACL
MLPNRGYSVGSYLRKFFESGYSSICLTFHHGLGLEPISPPSSEFAEAVLSKANLDTFLLDLHAEKPKSVQSWLRTPTKMRAIGPYYDPKKNPMGYSLIGSTSSFIYRRLHLPVGWYSNYIKNPP